VHAVCLLERRRGLSLDVQVLTPSPLPLAPYMLGLSGEPRRERGRFGLYADLIGSVAQLRLTCDESAPPEALADVLQRGLAERSAAVGERAAAPVDRPVALAAEAVR
jgi:hypothetical protein